MLRETGHPAPAPLFTTTSLAPTDAERLARSARRGDLTRLAPGMFTDSTGWQALRPWERHLLAAAAVSARSPETVFCRETALMLHGLPVVRSPRHVHVRTRHRERAGRDTGPTLAPGVPRVFRHEPALPRGVSRTTLRAQHRAGGELEHVLLAPPASSPAPDDLRVRAEPLELAVVDTVPRMPGGAGLAVLDALSRRSDGGAPWQERFEQRRSMLGARRREAQFDELMSLADARSESPGESVARWVFHQHGLQAPTLQLPVRLSGGRTVFPDFAWEEAGVVGEFDGMVKYSGELDGRPPADVVVTEKRREDELRALGWIVVRWVWSDLQNPERMVARLLRAGVPRRRLRL